MKRNVLDSVFAVTVAVAIAVTAFSVGKKSAAPGSDVRGVEISVDLKKDDVIELLEKSGINIKGKAKLTAMLLPSEITLEFSPSKGREVELCGIRLNNVRIPDEKVTDILKNYLDFKGVLVYN